MTSLVLLHGFESFVFETASVTGDQCSTWCLHYPQCNSPWAALPEAVYPITCSFVWKRLYIFPQTQSCSPRPVHTFECVKLLEFPSSHKVKTSHGGGWVQEAPSSGGTIVDPSVSFGRRQQSKQTEEINAWLPARTTPSIWLLVF